MGFNVYESVGHDNTKQIGKKFFFFQDIIDRLIIVNTEAKIHSLFNYEQSHIFGLR